MKALFELFRRFDARRIFGFIRRLGGMSRPKVKCYDLRSTHALRVEDDDKDTETHISIHALRVEGDPALFRLPISFPNFYPRPPDGGRSHFSPWKIGYECISIHALQVEGDPG